MAHETRLILNMTSEIGLMFADPVNNLPPLTTEADIMKFFDSMILEHESSFALKNSDINRMKVDINTYFDHLTSQKTGLIAEEGAAAAAQIVAGAATVAAAVGSWIPFVNFGLAATAVALTATAMGLEFAAEKLENTIIGELSNSNNQISDKYDSFKDIKLYTKTLNENTIFYPRFQLAASIKQMRALFLGVVIVIKKKNKGKCTAEDMKKTFLDYYNATKADPALVEKFITLMEELEHIKNVDEYKAKVAQFLASVPPLAKQIVGSISLMLSASKAIYYGKQAYSEYKAAKLALSEILEIEELSAEGEPLLAGEVAGESTFFKVAAGAGRALGLLAGAASIIFGELEIFKAIDTDQKLTKAIEDSRKGLTDYYTALVDQVPDGTGHGINVAPLLGNYENHKYDKGGKNGYHWVTVTQVNGGTIEWTTRNGNSWTLEMTPDKNKLEVNPDCIYYSNGANYKEAKVIWKDGKVTGILGPSNELFDKTNA